MMKIKRSEWVNYIYSPPLPDLPTDRVVLWTWGRMNGKTGRMHTFYRRKNNKYYAVEWARIGGILMCTIHNIPMN